MTFKVGDQVTWNWGYGTAQGKVTERFTDDVTRTLQGVQVTRNATSEEPAYLIEQDDGARVLKACREIQPA